MKMITGRYGRYASATDMYRALGVPDAKLPIEGMPERLIDGVRVYVKPLVKGATRKETFALRVYAICDDCARHIPVGRMHQHSCCKPKADVCEHGYAQGCRACDPDGPR